MIAHLMHKSDCIASLDVDAYGVRLHEAYCDIFPVQSPQQFSKWFSNRQTPYSRKYFMDVFKIGDINNYIDLVTKTGLLSVNDCWWIRTDSKQTWEDLNLFDHSFKSAVADILLTGKCKGSLAGKIYSPEFTLGGTFPKMWRHINNSIVLYKGCKDGNINYIYSELLVNQIYRYLNIPSFVEYDLRTYKDIGVCTCECFTSKDIEFYPAVYFLNGYPSYEVIRERFGCYELFYKMCLIDCVTLNIDRHTGNFGYLVSSDTHEIVGMSPVFDNNYALLPNVNDYSLSKDSYFHLVTENYSRFADEGFLSLGKKIMRDYKQGVYLLKQLESFKFKKVGGIQKDRLNFLSKLVNITARLIRG